MLAAGLWSSFNYKYRNECHILYALWVLELELASLWLVADKVLYFNLKGGLSTTAMVKIQVVDVNDNRPTFYPREYNVSLRERETVNSPVVVVVATDKDAGKYGTVRYAIVAGNEEGLFRVEMSSGEVFLTRPLTRARLAHRLNISATDGGGLRSAHDAEVLVTVIDSSHQPPIFENNRYLFSVREDAQRNSVIGTVSASSVTGKWTILYCVH